jgi:hypothetical protein
VVDGTLDITTMEKRKWSSLHSSLLRWSVW